MKKPIRGVVSPGQHKEIGMSAEEGVFLETGGSHDNLKVSARIMESRGKSLSDIQAVLVPIRNPYDLMVSNYYFLRQSYEKNPKVRTRKNFALAMESTFKEFCMKTSVPDFTNWITVSEGMHTPNIELIYFENLNGSLRDIAAKYGIEEKFPVPHINASKRLQGYSSMYDEDSRDRIARELAPIFEAGGYSTELDLTK